MAAVSRPPRDVDRKLVFPAIVVGMLLAAAGMWQAWSDNGNLLLGALLVWGGVIIAGVIWWHLLSVHRDQTRG